MKKIAPIHWLFLLSHSVQNAWIEISPIISNDFPVASHSVQNAWIEISYISMYNWFAPSRILCRTRGLKYPEARRLELALASHSLQNL